MPSVSRRLTKSAVEALGPSQTLWDGEIKGLAVRCQRRDRVFVLKYRSGGRQRWLTIGKHGSPWTVELARREARRLLGLIASGNDPMERKAEAPSDPTLSELAERFMEEHVRPKKKGRTAAEYKRLIEHVIAPELGHAKISSITHDHILRLHTKLKSTPYQANRSVALLSKMFNWSGRRHAQNPCDGVEHFVEIKRRRYLSSLEFARLAQTLQRAERENTLSPAALAALNLILLTGARVSEILTLKWDHVNFERLCLELPDSKTGAKTIHLSRPAMSLLRQIGRAQGNPYVVVGQRSGSHLVNLAKPWNIIRSRAELGDLRLHDLRHSFASVGAGIGLGLHTIGALLGHTQPGTTARYAHLASDPVKAANELIGERILELMSPQPDPRSS